MSLEQYRNYNPKGSVIGWLSGAASIGVVVVISIWVSQSAGLAAVPNKVSLPCGLEAIKGVQTLCSNKRLKEYAIEQLLFVKRRFPASYADLYNAFMRATKSCDIDEACLLEAYHNGLDGLGATEPSWYSTYLRQLNRSTADKDLTSISHASIGKAGSDEVDTIEGKASSGSTITKLENLDTILARAYSVVTARDSENYCSSSKLIDMRMEGKNVSQIECVDSEQRLYHDKTFIAEADCLSMKLKYYGHSWKAAGYRQGDIMWCGDENYIVEPSASTSGIDDRFRNLCPNTFSRIRADLTWSYPVGYDPRKRIGCKNN